MAEYQLKYTTTNAHFRAYAAAVPWRLSRAKKNHLGSKVFRVGLGITIGMLLLLVFITFDQACKDSVSPCWLDPTSTINGAIIAFAVFCLANVGLQRSQLHKMVSNDGAFLGPTKLTANYDRLEVFSEHVRATYDWEAFDRIDQEDTILILWIDKGVGVFIPRSCFTDTVNEAEFVAFCKDQIDRATTRKNNVVRFT
ncbi:MAG: YcxB family protein [Pseudomonadota bacterium]